MSEVRVLFERMTPGDTKAVVPRRATSESAGYDVFAHDDVAVPAGLVRRVATGIKVQCPPDWFILSLPRSGMALEGVTLANSVGLIDPDYGGEMGVLLANHGKREYVIRSGDRVCQILVLPRFSVEFQRSRRERFAAAAASGARENERGPDGRPSRCDQSAKPGTLP